MRREGMTEQQRTEAFWAKVHRGPDDACWEWTAGKHNEGYGVFWNGTRLVRATRFMWELERGPLPAGAILCHRCDNPPCVNPAHLFPGTHRDNHADMVTKGRDVDPPHLIRGEQQHLAKLTEKDVAEIRRLHRRRDPVFGARALARRYGVQRPTIANVVAGRTWKHVEEAS